MRASRVSGGRCAYAIGFDTLATRCMKQPGHAGPHEGKGLRSFPYQRIKWFQGDRREFITERKGEYAWKEKGGSD